MTVERRPGEVVGRDLRAGQGYEETCTGLGPYRFSPDGYDEALRRLAEPW